MSVIVEMWAVLSRSVPALYVRDAREGHTSGTIKATAHLADKPAMAAWSAGVFRVWSRKLGSDPVWVGRTKMLTWVTDDDPLAKKRKPVPAGLCWELGGEFIDACGRPVDPDSPNAAMCKMHASAKRRSDESMARHRAEWDDRRERERVDGLLTEDLRRLWLDVCDMRGIDRPGTVAIVDGRARVDHEVLSALLRELRDR